MDGKISGIKSKTKSWDHQLRAVDAAMRHSGFGIFAGPRTGKTKMAIDVMVNMGHKLNLVIVPRKPLEESVWEKQIALHGAFEEEPVIVSLVEGVSKKKLEYLQNVRLPTPTTPLIVIVNPETAWRGELGKFIQKVKWDFVVADEGHFMKAAGSKISRFMGRLGPKVKHRLVLTGTSMPNSPLDAYGVFRFINPKIFGTRYDRFRDEYAIMGGYGGYQVLSYRNLDRLSTKMAAASIVIKTEDVLNIPDEIYITRKVDMHPETMAVYKEFKKEFVAAVRVRGTMSAANTLVRAVRLQQLVGGHAILDNGSEEFMPCTKADALRNVLQDMPTYIIDGEIRREPVVVFARFHYDMDMVRRVASEEGYLISELSGRENGMQQWVKGHTDLMVVQQQSGSEGLDFSRARYAIYYSKLYSLGKFEQSKKRFNSHLQDWRVTYIHIVARNTIDELIDQALKEKRDVTEFILRRMMEDRDA